MSNDPRIIRCCDQPRLTRDERETRLATFTGEGVLRVDDTPVFVSGTTSPTMTSISSADTCGTDQELADD